MDCSEVAELPGSESMGGSELLFSSWAGLPPRESCGRPRESCGRMKVITRMRSYPDEELTGGGGMEPNEEGANLWS